MAIYWSIDTAVRTTFPTMPGVERPHLSSALFLHLGPIVLGLYSFGKHLCACIIIIIINALKQNKLNVSMTWRQIGLTELKVKILMRVNMFSFLVFGFLNFAFCVFFLSLLDS